MRQKGVSQKGCFKKCVIGGKKCSFFGKFGVLFLETPVLRFALLPYYRQSMSKAQLKTMGLNEVCSDISDRGYIQEVQPKHTHTTKLLMATVEKHL